MSMLIGRDILKDLFQHEWAPAYEQIKSEVKERLAMIGIVATTQELQVLMVACNWDVFELWEIRKQRRKAILRLDEGPLWYFAEKINALHPGKGQNSDRVYKIREAIAEHSLQLEVVVPVRYVIYTAENGCATLMAREELREQRDRMSRALRK